MTLPVEVVQNGCLLQKWFKMDAHLRNEDAIVKG
jgi:hypothetical protein